MLNKNCVNISSKEFKDLVKKYNVSAANMEDIIHEYLLKNNTNEFPSDDYIKAALEGTRTIMSLEQVDLWEKHYLSPKRFKTLLEFNNAKLTALKFFKKEAISEYTDADGNYVLKVAKPINKNYEKELLDILAKAPRDSQGRLLAPNGKPSNLTERQYALVRTKEFKEWFGDWENDPENASKVVDENGEPLVVYHESPDIFNTFDISKKRYDIHKVNGIWASAIDRKGRGYGENIYPLFMNLRNPINTSIKQVKDITELRNLENKALSNANSDGAILDTIDKFGYEIQYYVKNPNQVKSATDNIGTFSKEDDNINNNQIDFFEDNTDVRKKPQIKDNIEKGKDYTIDKLIELFNKYSIDKEQQELAKKVFAVAKKLNFKVLFLVDNLGWNIAGLQDYDVLKIARITTLEQNKNKLADVLLHETIHGVTTYAINAYKNGELKDKKLIEAVEELQNVYDSILDDKSIKDEYGLTNVKELVAELANPSFRDKLKKISIWEKLKNAIKKIFFFFSEGDVSAYTVLSDALDKFLDNYDVNLWNSYNITPNTKTDDFNFNIIDNQRQLSLQQEEIDPLKISDKTQSFGVTIDNNLIRNYRNWLLNNPNGIVAYRVNRLTFNTPLMVEQGIIGNPFNWLKYGTEVCLKMFYDWLVNGNNYNEPLATEDFRLAIINKLLNTQTPNILYYKELNMPSHATILGYLITNKQLINSTQLSLTLLQQLLSTLPIVTEQLQEESNPYDRRQQEIARQLDALQDSNLMTNTEIKEIADLVVYWISDHITELLQNPKLAVLIYGEGLKNIDTSDMERIDIVRAIGLDNIIEFCKLKFSPLNIGVTKISLLKKAKLITDNWLAIMQQANSTFAEIEKFSVEELIVKDKVISTVNSNFNENQDNFDNTQLNDEDSIMETLGNLQEHWQTKANTIDIMDSMSLLMRRAINHCYKLKEVSRDENNKPVYEKVKSEFGINLRIKPKDVTSSLLSWCKGSLNINDVISKLKEKEPNNPWISLIITRLEDLSGNETDFQSLFFGVFVKPFMTYSIVKFDRENNQYISQVVNKNPALKEAIKSITTLYKIGQHPMFLSNGKLNLLTFELFELAKKELDSANFALNFDTIVKDLGYMYNALGYSVTADMIKDILTNEEVFKTLYTQFLYIYTTLNENKDIKDTDKFQPFKFKGEGSILSPLRLVLLPITNTLEDTAETSFYDNGNMYQSYIIPSYMTKLMNKFHLEGELFDEFIKAEFAKYEWFKDQSARGIEKGWRNEMLRELVNNEEARKIFEHKVQLNFNKHQYMRNMDDTECALAILSEYWAETKRAAKGTTRVPAWFRIPMLSNKPSAEYIKFYSERGENYKDILTENFYKIFLLELSRILTVEARNYDKSDPEFIKNFDKNGKKFNFLDFMNIYLTGKEKNSELGKLIKDKLEGKLTAELELLLKKLATKAIEESIDNKATDILNNWNKLGIVEAAKRIEGIDTNNIEEKLRNFIWNDTYMSMNILELTITDKAYYKDEEDLLKRLALIHAPGVRANLFATDYQGNPVSDGKLRTFYLKDFDNFISNIVENVNIVFERRINEAKAQGKSELEINGLKALKDSLTRKPKGDDKGGLFYLINVADALGYSSPTSYRKKAFLFGKWNKLAEDIYQKLLTGEYTYSDLKTAFLPLKPFVYTQIEKNSNLSAEEGMGNLKVPILNKNSEYLLILADAILQGEDTGKPNLLRAIYKIMEESSVETKEITLNNGKKQIIRTPKKDGIDTVLFESTVKSGLRGAIDINLFYNMQDGEKLAKEYIESLIYTNKSYNETFVDAIPVEDYCLQLEVPAHFKNHELAHGSLIRAITPSDLLREYPDGSPVLYKVEGKELTADEFIKEYEDTLAQNIQESITLLRNELKLSPEATLLERNKALEKILKREILSSPRYGVDLLLACTLKNGEFVIPKGDPIQSKRIEQLLNSIIKNRINKLEIAGGPVVQVSNYGLSKELNIRFKDKNGGLLMTKAEFEKSPLAKKVVATSLIDKFNAKFGKASKTMTYELYIKENQAGIAYFEVLAPIYLNDIFEKFQNPDGSIDIKAIEELNPNLLKMIGYRIPTEDKYSCAPLKIVGFLPREAGDAIMLPNDITLLTGSDFKQYWSH